MTPSPASLASTLARAVDRFGLGLLSEPDKLKLQLDVAFPDAPEDIAQIMAALADGVPQSQLVAHDDGALEILLRGQVDRLVARTGVTHARATWVVRTWALALALPDTGLDSTAAAAKRRPANVPDFASVITPLSSTRRPRDAEPAVATSPVADMPAVAIPPAASLPAHSAASVVASPTIDAQPVVETPASATPVVLSKKPEPAEAVRVAPLSSREAVPQRPTVVLATADSAPRAGDGALRDAQEPVARPAPDAARPAPAVPRVDAAAQGPTRSDAATRTPVPSQAPVESAPVESPARTATKAPAAPRSAATIGNAAPAPRGPLPASRKAPLTPVPAIPLPGPSARPRQRRLAIASLVAVIAIIAAVTALRPDRDSRDRTANPTTPAPTPTPGPSVAATSAKGPPASADATTATPAVAPATLDTAAPATQSVASGAGATRSAGAPAAAAPVPAVSPVPAQGVAETPSTPAGPAASVAGASASRPPVPEPAALPARPPTIASVGVPRVTAGQPFRVVVELARGSAPVASIERRVVTGTADRTAESISTAKLPRTGSGALLLPFRAIAEPGRVVAELAPIGAEGTRGAARPVEIRVAPVSTADTAPAACTRSSCGSVAAVHELEGVTPGSVRGYTVVVRMDDRTIENVVLPTRPRLGQRMRKVGNRFVAG